MIAATIQSLSGLCHAWFAVNPGLVKRDAEAMGEFRLETLEEIPCSKLLNMDFYIEGLRAVTAAEEQYGQDAPYYPGTTVFSIGKIEVPDPQPA